MALNISRQMYFPILKRRASAQSSQMEILLTQHCQPRFAKIMTHRHLTFSVGYNPLPHKFIFKSSFFSVQFFLSLSELLYAFI